MSTQPPSKSLYLRAGLLGVAAVVALGVAIFAFTGGDGDNGDGLPAPGEHTPFGGTPIAELPGMPTPAEGTGMLGPGRPDIGEPAPDFALRDVRDPSVTRRLSDFAGTPVVLNWYASWCEPCKRELPEFVRVQGLLGDDVQFVAVNFIEDHDDALLPLEEFDVQFPALLDPSGTVAERYRIALGVPTTYFIDAGGIVRAQQIGELTAEELHAELANLGLEYEAP